MNTVNDQYLGERVRQARHEASLTQAQLGQRLGLSQDQIASVEAGSTAMAAADLPRWAAALDVPVIWLYRSPVDDLREQAVGLLGQFPEEEQTYILQMLTCMAQTLRTRSLQ